MARRFPSGARLDVPQPGDLGFKLLTSDPAAANTGTAVPTSGTLFLALVQAREPTPISSIWCAVANGAGMALGNVGFGLWTGAAGGALLASRVNAGGADATSFQSLGRKQITLATTVTVLGPIYIGFWFTWTTTAPSLARAGSTVGIQFNATAGTGAAATPRFASANTGLTTIAPTSLGALSEANNAAWLLAAA